MIKYYKVLGSDDMVSSSILKPQCFKLVSIVENRGQMWNFLTLYKI